MKYHVDFSAFVEASSFEEAKQRVDDFAAETPSLNGIFLTDAHIVNPDDELQKLVFSQELVKEYLLDGDEMMDDETIDLWNELIENPKMSVAENLGWLLAVTFPKVSDGTRFLEEMGYEDANMSKPFFWIDYSCGVGELCNGDIGDAIDSVVDFDLMAKKLIESKFFGHDDIKKEIKKYVLKKHLS